MGSRRYGRRSVETSNEDKVFFPDTGITKGDILDYYDRMADHILPHLKERPLVVQRFPDGIRKGGFYQKQAGDYFPDWITTTRVEVGTSDGTQELVVCDGKATLGYLANQACLTLHPWLSRTERIQHPDLMVIDLDPPGDDFEEVRRAALLVRDLLEELELVVFPKLTGSKGVHLAVPLDRSADFDTVRGFARAAMDRLAAPHSEALTTEQRKAKRRGRVYLDTGRSAYGQTAVASYSVRALPEAPVAAPLAWEELETKGIGPRDVTVGNVFRRLGQRADPWRDLRRRARSLGRARERLEEMKD